MREECRLSRQHQNLGGQCSMKVSVTKVMNFEEKCCIFYKLLLLNEIAEQYLQYSQPRIDISYEADCFVIITRQHFGIEG